ncbi:MAG: serine protease [Anaerolineaceae bacterium]
MTKLFRPCRVLILFTVLTLMITACAQPTPELTTLEVRSSNPSVVLEQGRDFEITVSITNAGQYNAHITGFRLPGSFLNQVIYLGSEPVLTMTTSAGGEGVLVMDLTIAPGGIESFTFKFSTMEPGTISGLGLVVMDGASYQFIMEVEVKGSNPAGWQPGIASAATPAALSAIPYQAVVQIKAMVEVEGEELIGWTGSGTIISTDGLILTNAHVVLSDRFYEVKDLIVSLTLAEDSPPVDTYLASIVQADASMDIALIKPRTDMQGNPLNYATLNLPAVPLGNSDALQLGDPLAILGYPGIGGDTITLTRGEVSGFTSEEPYGNRAFIKTSATIAGGNSGGLAVNAQGELVGVPTQVGSGDAEDSVVDCRPLSDTNRDGYIDENDNCVPTGGFINALRPTNLAMPLIEAARQGQVSINAGTGQGETYRASGQVVFEDDFSDPLSGWSTAYTAYGITAYENGELAVAVLEPDYLVWSEIDYSYAEIVLTVDARVIESVGDADFGFVCGLQDNAHFTVLEISEDGYYSFWKQDGDVYTSLIDWTYADEIAGGGPFTLSAYCGREGLGLAVNDALLDEFQDPDFVPGTVGLLAGTFSTSGFKVGFDNFELMLP